MTKNDGPASPPEGWQEEVTAETLTDDAIRDFRTTVLESDSAPYSIVKWDQLLYATKIALGEQRATAERRHTAKSDLAAAINARREGSK